MKKVLLITTFILVMAAVVFAEEGQILPAGAVLQSIKEYVVKNAGCSESDLLIEYKTPLIDEKLPAGAVSIEIKSGANTRFLGFTTLEVFILLDNKVYKSFLVYLEIDNKVKAYMANRWIKRYEPLNSENIGIIDTYRSKIPMDYLPVDAELTGMVAKIALGKGRILTRLSVETPPLIKNKDLVNVVLENGNVKINAKATALMDGRKDDTIKVRLIDSKKNIYGKVIDEHTVVVAQDR
jgi:flagella basal body P-ring formation protein FlgA